ncbi:molybdopterin-dependent oxidoreductase [Tomitella cavernea]|uniref:Oxidoreductase n=1 Tax=Tomitella cavernea TaxID=1387982 RepID=A0ABP9CPY2_9ACTN|nr:molybdopterin-dependent oxidoreductase [Tomitella cavernea]
MTQLDYPAWLRIEHWLNVLFLTFLIRSGIEILAGFPKMYWRNHSLPGTEWARFTRRKHPPDKLHDTLDDEVSYSSLIALPGHRNLGMGRHWHFVTVIGWILLGASYWALLFATGQYHRYVPYSWEIFPHAWDDIVTYMSFRLPPPLPGQPLDAVQKLSYFGVIFLLAPFQILTGAAQSPAVEARFPWYVRLWGGRQSARSLHLLGLAAFAAFIVVHLLMVSLWGWGQLNALMIFGDVRDVSWAIGASMGIIVAILVLHWAATVWSLNSPRSVQKVLGWIILHARLGVLRPMRSRQDYSTRELSTEHRVNGKPPNSRAYQVLAVHGFVDWKVHVGGLVENPMTLDMAAIRGMADTQDQRTLHNCVQGWSGIAEWSGLPLRDLVAAVRPLPEARFICFLTAQDSGRDEPSAEGGGQFYEIIDLELATDPQTLLAYGMNGGPLPIKHGAPLRLRVETQVGFKMAKWIEHIEFVSAYDRIGEGMGGWREDNVYFDKDVEV